MAFEYRLRFDDRCWFTRNRDRVADKIRELPSFQGEAPPMEFRLKDLTTDNPWPYDARIFLEDEPIIEVSIATTSFFVDVRKLVNWIRSQASVHVVDDDGEPVPI